MNPQRNVLDPFDIIASFKALHYSGASFPYEPDDIKTVIHAAIKPKGRPNQQEQGGLKEQIWYTVKQNEITAKQLHSLVKKKILDYIDSAQDVPEKDRRRARFWANQFISAWSPANCFWTNSRAVKDFLDSDGNSLTAGMMNWLKDLTDQDWLVKLSDPGTFKLGHDIARTPGKIVFRNDLMELIQYEPSTETTYTIPVVLIQPWINKYYIFDLRRENSFVRYLRNRHFTVFITSWKNPGTLLAALMAWLNRGFIPKRALPVNSWTLFASLVDFSDPGELDVFISPNIVWTIESLMRNPGYLDKQYIGMVFRMLRPGSLIWRYYVHNYLQGSKLPKSDVLFWNSDNTRLPEKMTSTYLNEFYLNNRLCQKDSLKMGGRRIDLGRVGQTVYVVGTQKDHISPWKEVFKIGGLIKGKTRYVLVDDGHIVGIVNPPSAQNRRRYRSGIDYKTGDPETWYRDQTVHKGSWWPDWAEWLSRRCGPLASSPSIGNETYPMLGEAPGTYVKET